MKRQIIEIDEAKCNGCGQCILACQEGALALVDGKAKLVGEILCDGLGACLGECPTGALKIIEREAEKFSEEAVKQVQDAAKKKEHHAKHHDKKHHDAKHAEHHAHHAEKHAAHHAEKHAGHHAEKHHDHHHDHHAKQEPEKPVPPLRPDLHVEAMTGPAAALGCGCPANQLMYLKRGPAASDEAPGVCAIGPVAGPVESELGHWPVKLELLRPDAPFLRGADLLLMADCAGVSVPDLHQRFLKGHAVSIACPKFSDLEAHIERLAGIIRGSGIKSLTVLHMEVPCCRGLVMAAERALQAAGLDIPLKRIKIGRNGKPLEEETINAGRSAAEG